MKKILLFRHESWIKAPHLTELLLKLGIPCDIIKIDKGDAIPKQLTKDVAGLIFFGGSMSVNDPLPWIQDELNLIKKAYQSKHPVLGHCLGSQLISKALGGQITTMKNNEIGWHSIQFLNNEVACEWQGNLPNNLKLLLWHHEEFTIPEGAASLYSTTNCANQAFFIDNILATVAHIEVSESMLYHWLNVYGYDISSNNTSVQSIEQIKHNCAEKMSKMYTLSNSFYIKWLKLAYPQNLNPDIYNKLDCYLT